MAIRTKVGYLPIQLAKTYNSPNIKAHSTKENKTTAKKDSIKYGLNEPPKCVFASGTYNGARESG